MAARPSTVQSRRSKQKWIVLECPTCGRREVVPPGTTGACSKGKLPHKPTDMREVSE